MKKNLSILTVIILVFISNIQAQTTVGLRVGLTMSSITNDDFYSESDKKQLVQLGIFIPVEIAINDKFSIQPELTFIKKGAKSFAEDGNWEYTELFKSNYLEVPILLKYSLPISNSKLYFTAGPSVGYWMSAKLKTIYKTDVDEIIETEDAEFEDSGDIVSNRIEIAMYLGAGYQYRLGPGYLVADMRFGVDLNDSVKFKDKSLKPDDYTATKNRNFIISLGYAFPIGGSNE